MVLTIDRSNSINGKARAYQLNEIVEGVYRRNGILSGLVPSRSSDDVVAYTSGTGIASATYFEKSSSTLTLAARDGTNPRYSLVVINSSGTVSEVAGSAASVPTPPAVPTDKVVIATCYVPQTGGGNLVVEDGRIILPQDNEKGWVYLGETTISAAASSTILTGLTSANWRWIKIDYDVIGSSNGSIGITLNADTTASNYASFNMVGATPGFATNAYFFSGHASSATRSTGLYEIFVNGGASGGINMFKGAGAGRQSTPTDTLAFGGYKRTGVNVTSVELKVDVGNLTGTARVWGMRA